MKILLIAGHGAGDPGAIGNGLNEADLTRELAQLVFNYLNLYADVALYPLEKNCYKESKSGRPPDWQNYHYVFEIHFNSFSGNATGTEILIDQSEKTYGVETRILNNICALGFRKRGVKRRNDLLNMNLCTNAGTSYALLETCFISNPQDIELYKNKIDQVAQSIAMGIADGFGIGKKEPSENSHLWMVQIGAYSVKENAERMANQVTEKGYDNFITYDGALYHVQAGAYRIQSNALARASELKELGFDTYIYRK